MVEFFLKFLFCEKDHDPKQRVEARDWHQLSSSIAVNLLFKTGSLTESGACGLSESGWPASPRDPPVSASRVLGFSVTRYCRGEGVELMAK